LEQGKNWWETAYAPFAPFMSRIQGGVTVTGCIVTRLCGVATSRLV